MKITLIAIISVIILFVPNAYAHYPDFEIKTKEDILKFCEFYFDEYELLGLDLLIEQHPNFPNLRACSILYKHVAWKSTHEARDMVLIAEIEKYLGESNHIKERHLREYDKMPMWVKKDAQMWVNDENTDARFAYSIRSMLNADVLSPPIIDSRNTKCIDNICLKESDYVKYQYTDKYGNSISEKYSVQSISEKGILIKSQIITRENKIEKEFFLNEQNKIPYSEKCCEKHEFIFPQPIKIGESVGGFKVIGETIYPFDGTVRPSMIAIDDSNKITVIIDKETGLMLSSKHEEKNIVTKWEKTELVDTNMFGKISSIHYDKMSIPKWWKTTTMWYVEGHISDKEYLDALENLIARNILTV